MNQQYNGVLCDMESFMSKHTLKKSYSLQEKEQIIIHLIEWYKQLKEAHPPTNFVSIQDEIHYFKHVKPQLISKIILFAKLYKIESEKPNLCSKSTYKYYKRQLLKLNHFFEDNREFYTYYKTKSTHLDRRFFLRNRHNIRLRLEPYLIDFDLAQTTSHCFKQSEMMAYDELSTYIKQHLTEMHTSPKKNDPYEGPNSKLIWTTEKRDLIELIYALHEAKAINHGQIAIQELINKFSYFFDIELTNAYNEFYKAKRRKSSITRFLDELRNALLLKGS